MNQPITILGIAGSLRRQSYNRAALRAAAELVPEGVTLDTFELHGIPIFNEDDEQTPPAAVVELKRRIRAADAILFVTPEYNYSVPAVLKNAIDWASRPYGDSAWPGKTGRHHGRFHRHDGNGSGAISSAPDLRLLKSVSAEPARGYDRQRRRAVRCAGLPHGRSDKGSRPQASSGLGGLDASDRAATRGVDAQAGPKCVVVGWCVRNLFRMSVGSTLETLPVSGFPAV